MQKAVRWAAAVLLLATVAAISWTLGRNSGWSGGQGGPADAPSTACVQAGGNGPAAAGHSGAPSPGVVEGGIVPSAPAAPAATVADNAGAHGVPYRYSRLELEQRVDDARLNLVARRPDQAGLYEQALVDGSDPAWAHAAEAQLSRLMGQAPSLPGLQEVAPRCSGSVCQLGGIDASGNLDNHDAYIDRIRALRESPAFTAQFGDVWTNIVPGAQETTYLVFLKRRPPPR